jgi:hypothetical protein
MPDVFGYSLSWEDDGTTPDLRLCFQKSTWDLSQGEHPALAGKDYFARSPRIRAETYEINPRIQLTPAAETLGHHVVIDGGFSAMLPGQAPIIKAPIFIQDLAGRTLHAGFRDTIPSDGFTFGVTHDDFVLVTGRDTGSALLGNVFFTSFRCLDMPLGPVGVPSGEPNLRAVASYGLANMYPYKLRLDTFYIDGWKLPQTQYLYCKADGIRQRDAAEAGAKLMRAWADRPTGQSYADFYDAQGEAFFADLFEQGCTLIPTFEAQNGFNKVSADFELLDFWPGRAVSTLHEVIDRRPSDAPEGTILEVFQPGYLTKGHLEKARVAVSDGSKYASPHADAPMPLYPDLRLPHQRTTGRWGATWLPTHPAHFEPPALWGWDEATGHFLQQRGPLWDPLHYYYASVDKVLAAYAGKQLKDNRHLVRVPDDMKTHFYPVVPMRGFDLHDRIELQRRQNAGILPITLCHRFDSGKESCGVGYHPLPPMFDYELDSWWFPELDPRQRVTPQVPINVEDKLAGVIQPTVEPGEYVAALSVEDLPAWMTNRFDMHLCQRDSQIDYPHLRRFVGEVRADEMESLVALHLEHVDDTELNRSVLEDEKDSHDAIEEHYPGFYRPLIDFREAARLWLRKRHQLYREHPALYLKSWWDDVPAAKIAIPAGDGSAATRKRLPTSAYAPPPTV